MNEATVVEEQDKLQIVIQKVAFPIDMMSVINYVPDGVECLKVMHTEKGTPYKTNCVYLQNKVCILKQVEISSFTKVCGINLKEEV